jgi:hypothetical protein
MRMVAGMRCEREPTAPAQPIQVRIRQTRPKSRDRAWRKRRRQGIRIVGGESGVTGREDAQLLAEVSHLSVDLTALHCGAVFAPGRPQEKKSAGAVGGAVLGAEKSGAVYSLDPIHKLKLMINLMNSKTYF